jgi:hypothetical protein
MEIDELPENDERLLKKPEIKRDDMGRFEQAGTGLNKKSKNIDVLPERKPDGRFKNGGARPGAGRPLGSQNKTSLALKELILGALDEVGGKEYLARLAVENSSAFASLLGKVLPSTLDASESSRGPTRVTFQRIVVWPNGHKDVETMTPKQLPPPSSHDLPSDNVEPVASSDSDDQSAT